MKEKDLLSGSLEETNESYALAKIVGIKLVEAYRKQFSRGWISLMPTNLYGPRDNFDPGNSHVIPGLIRKFHDAKISSQEEIRLWGSGNPLREFLFSADLADACLFALNNDDGNEAINIGSGEELSIRELAIKIAATVGFEGEIFWDESYPDGAPRKLLDSSIINALGWSPKINLSDGLSNTYEWYLSGDQIR